MTVVQSLASPAFVFPDPSDTIRYDSSSSSLSSSYSDTASYLGSIKGNTGVGSISRSFKDDSFSMYTTESPSHQSQMHSIHNNNSPTSYFTDKPSSSISTPFEQQPKQSPQTLLTIDSLIQTDISYSTAKSNASNTASRFAQLLLHYNIVNRLHVALNRFHSSLAEHPSSRYDSTKFTSSYQQAIDVSSYLLKDDCTIKTSHFPSMLKYRQRELLNSFLTLLKSAPSFISTTLLSMSASDLTNFIGNSDIYEDISSLNRTRPLDILYYSVFPPDTPDSQRSEYFASICAALIEHKRGASFCYAIFDRILDDTGHTYTSALEIILYTLLQKGSFLTSTQNGNRPIGGNSAPSSAPTSEYPSPELPNATLSSSTSSLATATATSAKLRLRKPSSVSLSSSNDEPNDLVTQEFLRNSVELIVEFLDNQSTGSIPNGFLTFSKLVISKVPEKSRRSATLLIVVKYFFSVHLRRSLLFPERLGMLADYYVSDAQRKKILALVFNKLYHLVMSYAYGAHQEGSVVNSSLHEKTKKHLESIISRFDNDEEPIQSNTQYGYDSTPLGSTPVFSPLPTESLYCSRGQLFVLAPSDIVCIYSALFPSFALRHRSPMSQNHNTHALNVENQRRPYSQYGFSSSLAAPPISHSVEASSYIHGSSSIVSGSHSNNESLPSLTEMEQALNVDGYGNELTDDSANTTPLLGPSEDYAWSLDDIKSDLEPVIEELIKKFPYLQFRDNSQYFYSLRPNKLQNFKVPHPLSEKWQIFQVGNDSTVHDVRPDSILDQIYSSSNANDSPTTHESDDQIFSLPVAPANRGLVSVIRKAVEKLISQISNSPYPVTLGSTYVYDRAFSLSTSTHPNGYFESTPSNSYSSAYLTDLLAEALEKSVANNKFLDANEYSTAANALKKLLPSTTSSTYAQVTISLNNYVMSLIAKEKNFNLNRLRNQIELCGSLCAPCEIQLQAGRKRCNKLLVDLGNLRTKVWYSTEIRNSALWTRAKDVALALTYGTNLDNAESPVSSYSPMAFPSLKRNNSSSSVSSLSAFSFKRFTSGASKRDYGNNRRHSVVGSSFLSNDGMFAAKELAGVYKLSDREAEATKKWLEGQHIQNFCTGEERIHRFCCEVDDLVKRVMGDALSSQRNKGHSLLSSSLLFRQDLWKLIVEVEGSSRSSTPSINPSYGHRASIGVMSDNDLSDITHLRSMQRPSIDRSSSYRGHRSQKSSPNFLEVFSSLDLGSKRPSVDAANSGDLSESFSGKAGEGIGHRRNRSLNEVSGAGGSGGNLESLESLSMRDEVSLLEADSKRRELDETILALQMRLTSLIYTDIGTNCFYDGSETDKWIDSPIVTAAIERDIEQQANLRAAIAKNTQGTVIKLHEPSEPSRRLSKLGLGLQSSELSDGGNQPSVTNQSEPGNVPVGPSLGSGTVSNVPATVSQASKGKFNIDDAYKKILQKLSIIPSPLGKLHMLYELEMLVVSSLSASGGGGLSTPGSVRSHRTRSNMTSLGSETPGMSRNITRAPSISAMTSLGETIATVEAKRSSSGAFAGSQFFHRASAGPSTDSIAEELRRVLKSRALNSKTLFRDLQFISAFVPPHMLDLTDLGKSFWDVSLAALSIKEEALGLIVDTATEIFQYKTGMISSAGVADHKFLSQWSLADCAWLWSIASKEGDVAGQRELAIMHMSHPDITPITLLPFSKLSEVFEPSLLEDPRILDDLDKYDPIRMAVIKHWMSSAAIYGDAIATEYLMQQTPQGYI